MAWRVNYPNIPSGPRERWAGEELDNGDLLRSAEDAGFNLLLTTDQRIRYQQNLTARKIAIVVISGTTKWSRVRLNMRPIVAAVNAATTGSYTDVSVPFAEPDLGTAQ